LLLDTVTIAPPAGAGALSVTVFCVVGVPPWIAFGESVTAVTTGPAATLFTVTVTPLLVPVFPPESVTTAVSVCVVLVAVVVFQLMLYGADVTADPRLLPSNWNCTLATLSPPLAAAVAVTGTVPLTVDPLTGAVMLPVGGTAALLTVTATPLLVPVFPPESVTTAVNVCVVFVAVVVFQLIL